ncbi:site-specific integrase [Rhizobium laguerreae]|nr:site-specific integrase [Rhizobium laguerreae]
MAEGAAKSGCRTISVEHSTKIALALWIDFWGPATVNELTVPRQFEFMEWLKARGYKNAYCMIALNTLARPDAVLDLAPAQVNLKDRRISLNPQGRKQTKKFRPIVPITDTLLSFVQETDRPRFVTWHGKAVNRIDGSFGRMIANAQLPSEITPYSLRHTMATELRRRGVPPWEVEGLLGHRRPGVTEKYAHFAPDYLSEGRAAIDAYFAELSIGYTLPTLICVPSACQSQGMEKSAEADLPTSTGNWMVGVTGIEPVTPTMST